MKNFLSRLITGAGILVAILVIIFSESRLLLFLGTELITLICLEELFHAFYPHHLSRYWIWGQLLNFFANFSAYLFNIQLYLAVWTLAVVLLFILSIFQPHKSLQNLMQILFSVIYITFLFCFVYFFPRDRQDYLLFIILIAWGSDTFAYLVGSQLGRTPVTEISPNKTWEGCIGGVVGAILLCSLATLYFKDLSALTMVIVGAFGSVLAQLGDVFASSLKRRSGIKDFSHILRSHGGFLDRFDSVIFTIPYVWAVFVLYLF